MREPLWYLWLHRAGMIFMLPVAIAIATIVGPFLALGTVVELFLKHWKRQ